MTPAWQRKRNERLYRKKIAGGIRRIAATVPGILARVKGRLFFETKHHANEQARNHSALQWINLAHRGTLEKIPDMLSAPGLHGTMKLLATARNVFENQV